MCSLRPAPGRCLAKRFFNQALTAAMAVSASGCFRYIPTELAGARSGEQVRLYVSRAELASLGDLVVGDGAINGTFVRREATNLVVRLPVTVRETGLNTQVLGQDVFIPNDQVLQFERREVNRPMTAVLTVAGSAAMAGLVFLIIGGARSSEHVPEEGPVELIAR